MTTKEMTPQRIIAVLRGGLRRTSLTRARLEELKKAREKHLLTTLLPAERAYRDAERIDFGFDVGIAELERALQSKEDG